MKDNVNILTRQKISNILKYIVFDLCEKQCKILNRKLCKAGLNSLIAMNACNTDNGRAATKSLLVNF